MYIEIERKILKLVSNCEYSALSWFVLTYVVVNVNFIMLGCNSQHISVTSHSLISALNIASTWKIGNSFAVSLTQIIRSHRFDIKILTVIFQDIVYVGIY